MSVIKKNYLSLVALLLLFILPGIVAYIVFLDPSLLGSEATNHGKFIKPPVKLAELSKSKKWRLVYYSPVTCNTKCMGNLDKLARIRLALGRRLYNVDAYLFLPEQLSDLGPSKEKVLQDVGVHVLKFATNKPDYQKVFIDKSAFFIVSPENYLIMNYDVTSSSEDIFQDLKKLVND